jgi:predicted nucleic acid-binding protein
VILVDTSVWIDHLRKANAKLSARLDDSGVLTHPFIVGELALGHLRKREAVLRDLTNLPLVTTATDAEVLRFIENERLFGRGIGYVDAHLLASARLTPGTRLWTKDKRLHAIAARLNLVS